MKVWYVIVVFQGKLEGVVLYDKKELAERQKDILNKVYAKEIADGDISIHLDDRMVQHI